MSTCYHCDEDARMGADVAPGMVLCYHCRDDVSRPCPGCDCEGCTAWREWEVEGGDEGLDDARAYLAAGLLIDGRLP